MRKLEENRSEETRKGGGGKRQKDLGGSNGTNGLKKEMISSIEMAVTTFGKQGT